MNMMNVTTMVADYFEREEGLKNYEPIAVIPNGTDEYLYRVLGKYIEDCPFKKKNSYAVWMSFNTSTGSMNNGHYDMSYENAYELFATGKNESDVGISTERLVELGKTLADEVDSVVGDPEESYQLFKSLGLTEEELELFEIKKPKRYKKVDVEIVLKFPVIMEENEEEQYFGYEDYAREYIENCGIDTVYTTLKSEGVSTKDALENYQDCYGIDDIEQ